MTIRYRSFALGMVAGIGVTFCLGATVPQSPPEPLRPVEVTLHRFDRKPGSEATFREWIDYLRSHHREAVATLGRERTYFEAMFIAPDEPRRLYWLEVKGAGGKPVESSDHELDRRHMPIWMPCSSRGRMRGCRPRTCWCLTSSSAPSRPSSAKSGDAERYRRS